MVEAVAAGYLIDARGDHGVAIGSPTSSCPFGPVNPTEALRWEQGSVSMSHKPDTARLFTSGDCIRPFPP